MALPGVAHAKVLARGIASLAAALLCAAVVIAFAPPSLPGVFCPGEPAGCVCPQHVNPGHASLRSECCCSPQHAAVGVVSTPTARSPFDGPPPLPSAPIVGARTESSREAPPRSAVVGGSGPGPPIYLGVESLRI